MIEQYSDTKKQLWDSIVYKCVNGTFMHKADFFRYHKDKFKDCSITIDNKFAFPANFKEHVVYSHGGLSYAGLLYPYGIKLSKYLKVFYELLNYYKQLGFKELLYKQTPSIYWKEFQGKEEYALQLSEAVIYRQDSNVVIDCKKINKLSERKRRNIKNAEQSNLYVTPTNNYETYWNEILIPCLKNTHNVSPTHSLEEILLLKKLFPEHIEMTCIYSGSKMLGGVTWFKNDNVLHSQYIASNDLCKQSNGLDLLFSKSLNLGYEYLSFGVCNEENGTILNQGLSSWKEEFGANILTHKFYKIDLTKNFDLLKRNINA